MKISNLILLLFCSVCLVKSLPYIPIKGTRKLPTKPSSIEHEERGHKEKLTIPEHIDCSEYLKNDEEGSGSGAGSGAGSGDSEESVTEYSQFYDDEELYILCRHEANRKKETEIGDGVSPYSPKSSEPELGSGLDPFHHETNVFDLNFGIEPVNPEDSGDSIGSGIAPLQPESHDTTVAVFATNRITKYFTTITTLKPEVYTKRDSDHSSTVYPYWPNGGVDHSRSDNNSPHDWWENLGQHWKSLTSKASNAKDSVRITINSWYTQLHKKIPEVMENINKTISKIGLTIRKGKDYVVERITQGFDKIRALELKKKLNQCLKEGNKMVDEFLQKIGEKVNAWMKTRSRGTITEEFLPEDNKFPNFFQDPDIHQRLDRMVSDGILIQTDVDRLYNGQPSEKTRDTLHIKPEIKQNKVGLDASNVARNPLNEVDDSYYTAKGLHSQRSSTNQDKFDLKEIYFPA